MLALAVALPALAQQRSVTPPPGIEEPPPPPAGAVSVSPDGRIALSPEVCNKLRRAAAASPGADYRPGVDVNGDAVAPADLPPDTPPMTLNVPIAIGTDLQKRYGVGANSTLLRHGAIMGLVTLSGGSVFFNGEPISGSERDMMLKACAQGELP
jgi:hypothetical protein